MIQVESVHEVMDERQAQYATAAVEEFENARMSLHRAGVYLGKAGLPVRFRSKAARDEMEVEDTERSVVAYMGEMSR